MAYVINAYDTAGRISLRRDTVPGALKKASELAADGCLDVQIEMPDGSVLDAQAIDSLRAEAALSAS